MQQLWGVWVAIANKMKASQETCFGGKYNPRLPPDYQTVCSKKKASIQSYLNCFKVYVEKLKRNDIEIWGVWEPPEASDISKNRIKWKPGIYFFLLFGSVP